MPGNTFGTMFRLTTFGESHGPSLGGVIDGCPAGLPLTEEDIQLELDKRKPGQGLSTSSRKEGDQIQILSGIFEGRTTGTSIGFLVPNQDQQSRDYDHLRTLYRPGHADFSYRQKYGLRDHRGGGRASARETVCRVAGGAVAQRLLQAYGVDILAYTRELGGIQAEVISPEEARNRPYFAPDPSVLELWQNKVEEVRKMGDSLGGIVEIAAMNVPPGLGEPVFDKLDARLSYAMMGVGAVKAVEIGAGRDAAELMGSQNNDPLRREGFTKNDAGGMLGGISTGQPIIARATVKPIPSIALPQQTLNEQGEEITFTTKGRHDVSAIPRIIPVLKAMVSLVLADMLLMHQSSRLHQ
ncbi:chorismate synthase [Desulfovermiculus halophilus]|jgi:chorismate synthase|uniref:chorismate synthase n=1 Tax=Desulfovermiculus halophilus TaxID=339722 RepID=UPI0004877467|nr:chorismate synthase [Desulfovermiculus halophilus]